MVFLAEFGLMEEEKTILCKTNARLIEEEWWQEKVLTTNVDSVCGNMYMPVF